MYAFLCQELGKPTSHIQDRDYGPAERCGLGTRLSNYLIIGGLGMVGLAQFQVPRCSKDEIDELSLLVVLRQHVGRQLRLVHV